MMSPKVTNIFVFLILVALSLVIFANSMTKPLGRDEQMYCTAGILLAQGKMIYRDFSYPSQMPYHPLLYAALFRILNTTHFLLVARIFSCLCDILVAVCIVGIYWRIFSSFPISAMLLGTSAAVLYVFNPLVDYAGGFAWNHDVVIVCVVLSFWLFISIDFKKKSKYWRTAAIGALLTFATFMRITTVLVQLLFFLVLIIQSVGSVKQRLKAALPFLIATIAVSIWPVWIIALAPRAFFLNVFRIPVLNSKWLHQMGMVYSKLLLTLISITTPGYFVLIVIAIYLCVILLWKRPKLTVSNAIKPLLAPLLTLTFIIIAFIPPTIWKQYLATPVPFLIISFSYPLLYLRKLSRQTGCGNHFNIASALVAVCVFVAVIFFPAVPGRIPMLFKPQSWVPVQLHRISGDIAEKTKSPKLILTLAPLYALEGGCDIYNEFSSGSFVYRVADYLFPSDRRLTHTVGPGNLRELVEKSPPSTVILGVEFEFLEAPLFQMTVQPDRKNWEERIYENDLIVYFRR
jgi:hypothetical protein